MKKILLGVALSLLPYFAQAQLTVERNGQVKIDAHKGGFNRGLRISTSADLAGSYGEDGTALLLENGAQLAPCATCVQNQPVADGLQIDAYEVYVGENVTDRINPGIVAFKTFSNSMINYGGKVV